MQNVKNPVIASLIVLFPLWGILLPLKVIEFNVVYIDPPIPTFVEFLQLFFTDFDLYIISSGWLLLFLAAFLIHKIDTRCMAIIYFAVAIFMGYSIILFANGRSIPYFIVIPLGISISLGQGIIYLLTKMLNFGSVELAQ